MLLLVSIGGLTPRARATITLPRTPGHRGNAIIRKVKPVSLGQQVRRG